MKMATRKVVELIEDSDDWSLWNDLDDETDFVRSPVESTTNTPTTVRPMFVLESATATTTTTSSSSSSTPAPLLPPQLHPAVSLGMRRMSSCYFSIQSESTNSVADLLSLLETTSNVVAAAAASAASASEQCVEAPVADLLYHDILMNVFGYLDAKDLAAFSETARRPNFECFYYLQLQLQRALLLTPSSSLSSSSTTSANHTHETAASHHDAIAGVGALKRLSQLDRSRAEDVVQTFLQSNSTLCHLPLSHSLAYLRQLLRRHHLDETKTAASAALLITLLGGASLMSNDISFGTDLIPNMIFRVGFVGSLMGAARTVSQKSTESLTQAMQEYSQTVLQQVHDVSCKMQAAVYSAARAGSKLHVIPISSDDEEDDDDYEDYEEEEEKSFSPEDIMVSSPYAHITPGSSTDNQPKKLSSGCVGAYSRAIAAASHAVTDLIKQRRRARFQELSAESQAQVSRRFMDACASDDTLAVVKELIHTMDVEGFYIGSDGTETCALHTSAFHGAVQVVEFLCQGIDEHDMAADGGLVNVNTQDANGWTALHFAAGANAAGAIRVLLHHGARVDLEALNGYNPLQWAVRLHMDAAADELRHYQESHVHHPYHAHHQAARRRQAFSDLASRFFALIPTH